MLFHNLKLDFFPSILREYPYSLIYEPNDAGENHIPAPYRRIRSVKIYTSTQDMRIPIIVRKSGNRKNYFCQHIASKIFLHIHEKSGRSFSFQPHIHLNGLALRNDRVLIQGLNCLKGSLVQSQRGSCVHEVLSWILNSGFIQWRNSGTAWSSLHCSRKNCAGVLQWTPAI